MPFLFRCPHCESETWIESQFCGKTGPCAVCGRLVTIPYADQLGAQPIVVSAESLQVPGPSGGTATLATKLTSQLRARVATGALILFGLAIVWMVFSAARPFIRASASAAQLRTGRSNLEKIVAAMRAYQADHGSLPPPFLAGPDGKPAHSWRVLLLPYLGHKRLYDQYDFDSPWSSANNKALLSQMPMVYAAPTDANASSSWETSYMVVVGKKTAFPEKGGVTMNDISDRHDETLLVVEIKSKGVTWMEPVDLDWSTTSFAPNIGTNGPSTYHPTDLQGGFADGVTRNIPINTSAEDMASMFTIKGGEKVTTFEEQ